MEILRLWKKYLKGELDWSMGEGYDLATENLKLVGMLLILIVLLWLW